VRPGTAGRTKIPHPSYGCVKQVGGAILTLCVDAGGARSVDLWV